jgi:hypothetical protein
VTEHVVILFLGGGHGGGWIALTPSGLTEARALAAKVLPALQPPSPTTAPKESTSPCHEDSEPLLDAAGMAAKTGVPESWWESAARGSDPVPHMRFGRWVRFRYSEAVNCERVRNRRTSSLDETRHADALCAAPISRRRKKRSVTTSLPRKSCGQKFPDVSLPVPNKQDRR